MRVVGWIIVAALALTAGLGSAQAPPAKVALVIGNAAYAVETWRLANPRNDATEIARRLRRMGFDVDIALDATRAQMDTAMSRFVARLTQKGSTAVGFFYYAGHAAQRDDINYLVPVDANAPTVDVLQQQAPALQSVFDGIAAAGNSVNVIVLDACRDMPLPEGGGELSSGGLAEAGRRGAMFIAYATAPGGAADDTDAGANSPYTTALIAALDNQQADPIALLFEDVNARVYIATGGRQRPEYRNGLFAAPRWSFAAAGVPAPPPPGLSSLTPTRALTAPNAFLQSLDRRKLLELAPRNVFFVDVLLARRDLLANAEIDTPLRLAHFLAQVGVETLDFRPFLVENMNYTATRLRTVFPRHFPDDATAQLYAMRPEKTANRVYAKFIGNGDEASGDGWRYRGRGFFQTNGRANYRSLSTRIGVDLEGSPDLMTDPEVALAAAISYWDGLGLNPYADADNGAAVSRGINRGNPRSSAPALREAQRIALTARTKAAVGLSPPPPAP